jgi:ribose transport system permease protein
VSNGTALRRTADLLSPRRISVVYLFVFIMVLFGTLSPDLFLSSVTFQAVGASQAVVFMIALAAMLPLIAGEFDITIGVMMALSLCIVCQQSVEHPDRSLFLVCVAAVVICGLLGLVNGLLIVKLRVSSFIATLAMSQIIAAIAVKISNNSQIRGDFPEGFREFGQHRLVGIPVPMLVAFALGVVLWYLLDWTKVGRQGFAVGMNREAARLSGVRTDALIIGSFVASGLISGGAGVVYATQIGVFSNSIGMPLLFPAFAAIFLGATQFTGRPNVWGTFLALIALALGVQGLQLTLTTGGFWITPMFNGVALILAVIFSTRQGAVSEKVTDAPLEAPPPPEDDSGEGAATVEESAGARQSP